MDINALNNVFFASNTAGLGVCNKTEPKTFDKVQSETLNTTTDNNISPEYDVMGSVDDRDFKDTLAEKTSNNTTVEKASDESGENTDNKSVNETESDNAASEGTLERLIYLEQNNLLGVGGSAGDEVSRVVGEMQSSMPGAEGQTVPGMETGKDALLNQAQNGEQLAGALQDTLTDGEQKTNEGIEFISQGNEQANHPDLSGQAAIEAAVQAKVKTGQDSGQQQNQSTQQLGSGLESGQTVRNNQQQELNLGEEKLLSNMTAEQASVKTEEQKGQQADTLSNTLQNEDFGSPAQRWAGQKSEAKTDSGNDLLSTANEGGQIFAAANEQKPANTVMQNFENNNGDFTAQFGKAVSEQIQASISNSVKQGENKITINLNPPELGRVSIKLQEENGQITGLLEFSKPETKSEVQQLLPQLVKSLQDSGVAVKKLDVVQTSIDNSTTYQQYRDNAAGEGAFNQQQFGQNQTGNIGSGYDWVTGKSDYTGDDYFAESYINDETMNVLV
ncbi:MAG: flagellar hook-length control protein FliK [Sedimentisphaerales bacterium]|nr:flagellar hook-length control protein FliK [Sedimentisphaerales bacterium]